MAGEEIGERAAERPDRPEKPEKTPEDLAAIALLDALRAGTAYEHPEQAPLACIVRNSCCTCLQKVASASLMSAKRLWQMVR